MSDFQSNAVVWNYGPVLYDVTSIICTRYKKRNNVQPFTSILPYWYSGRNVRDICRAQGCLLCLVSIEVPVNLNFHLYCTQAARGSVKLWAEAAAGRKVLEVIAEARKMA